MLRSVGCVSGLLVKTLDNSGKNYAPFPHTTNIERTRQFTRFKESRGKIQTQNLTKKAVGKLPKVTAHGSTVVVGMSQKKDRPHPKDFTMENAPKCHL